MRKNKMLRMASALLISVLLTTSVISGTFAKYVTTATATDNARVAKWGITMENGTSMFKTTYATDDTTKYTGANSVETLDADRLVVAPGTSGSTTYLVGGKPETAYEITFAGTKKYDVFLGTEANFVYSTRKAKYSVPGNGKAAADYYPISYSVTIAAPAGATLGKVDPNKDAITERDTAKKIGTLEEALAVLSNTKLTYGPNEPANLTVTIGWEWPFYTSPENDKYDTVLGDIIAQNSALTIRGTNGIIPAVDLTENDSQYSTKIEFDLAITATQID